MIVLQSRALRTTPPVGRSALVKRLAAALREATVAQRQVSVLVFGLDGRSTYVAGSVLRAGEELCRIGDDTFAVVIEGSAETGRRVVERVQATLAAETRGHGLRTPSAGVATFPFDGRRAAELLAAAEEALSASKRGPP